MNQRDTRYSTDNVDQIAKSIKDSNPSIQSVEYDEESSRFIVITKVPIRKVEVKGGC